MFFLFSTCDSKEVLEHYESILPKTFVPVTDKNEGPRWLRPVKGPTIDMSLEFLISLPTKDKGPDFICLIQEKK